MRHPHERYILAEIVLTVLAIICGLLAWITSFIFMLYLSIYCIAFSIVCEGIIALSISEIQHALKHAAKAVILLIIATCLLFI